MGLLDGVALIGGNGGQARHERRVPRASGTDSSSSGVGRISNAYCMQMLRKRKQS